MKLRQYTSRDVSSSTTTSTARPPKMLMLPPKYGASPSWQTRGARFSLLPRWRLQHQATLEWGHQAVRVQLSTWRRDGQYEDQCGYCQQRSQGRREGVVLGAVAGIVLGACAVGVAWVTSIV